MLKTVHVPIQQLNSSEKEQRAIKKPEIPCPVDVGDYPKPTPAVVKFHPSPSV